MIRDLLALAFLAAAWALSYAVYLPPHQGI